MLVRTYGYFTQSGELEARCRNAVRKYAAAVLGPHLNKVFAVNIFFRKKDVDWTKGYKWLWRKGQVTIAIPKGYRRRGQAEWLVCHELCHVRQRIEGRLNRDFFHIRYVYPRGEYVWEYRWNRNRGDFRDIHSGRWMKERYPWEIEANRRARKVMRRRFSKRD